MLSIFLVSHSAVSSTLFSAFASIQLLYLQADIFPISTEHNIGIVSSLVGPCFQVVTYLRPVFQYFIAFIAVPMFEERD